VAVNLASGVYSTLLVLATYLLGTIAFSPLIGIGAASALAVDGGAIYLGADGWRDDAFAFFVVMSIYALLRLWRSPSPRTALFVGTLAAGTMLTRVTGVSFILAGFVGASLDGARADMRYRASMTVLALAVAATIAAPFFADCASKFGTALHLALKGSMNERTSLGRSSARNRSAGPTSLTRAHMTLRNEAPRRIAG
jgi:4-amino-4-deoxy-L-arabinose transferase-like glycosyltransferase